MADVDIHYDGLGSLPTNYTNNNNNTYGGTDKPIATTSTATNNVGGTDKPIATTSTATNNVGGTDKPIATTSTSTNTNNIGGTDKAIATTSTSNIGGTDKPIKLDTDQKSAIDVKPLVIDSCQTTRLAPLPNTCVDQPYHHHVGLTFMGFELWGVNLRGRSEMSLRSPQPLQFRTTDYRQCREDEERRTKHHKRGLRVRVGGEHHE